jgi:hypothetical protein
MTNELRPATHAQSERGRQTGNYFTTQTREPTEGVFEVRAGFSARCEVSRVMPWRALRRALSFEACRGLRRHSLDERRVWGEDVQTHEFAVSANIELL